MNGSQLQSAVDMTPRETIELEVWRCRHCRAVKPVNGKKPLRCWNYKCRRMDWDRPPKKRGPKPGRPRIKRDATKGRKMKGRK